jgi:DNA-binding NarL/FixJ family response regulator
MSHRLTTVGIVDDHYIFRDSLSLLIKSFLQYEVTIKACDGQDLIDALQTEPLPDVIILDVEMPGMNGKDTLQFIRKQYSEKVMIIVLSMYKEPKLVQDLLNLGANGFVTKSSSPEILHNALRFTISNGFYLSPDVAKELYQSNESERGELNFLEKEIVQLVCDQLTNSEIARKMHLERSTVNSYRTRILDKLSVRNTAGLVVWAIKSGLYDLHTVKD